MKRRMDWTLSLHLPRSGTVNLPASSYYTDFVREVDRWLEMDRRMPIVHAVGKDAGRFIADLHELAQQNCSAPFLAIRDPDGTFEGSVQKGTDWIPLEDVLAPVLSTGIVVFLGGEESVVDGDKAVATWDSRVSALKVMLVPPAEPTREDFYAIVAFFDRVREISPLPERNLLMPHQAENAGWRVLGMLQERRNRRAAREASLTE